MRFNISNLLALLSALKVYPPQGGGGGGAVIPKPYADGYRTFLPATNPLDIGFSAGEGYIYRISVPGSCNVLPTIEVFTAGAAGSKCAVGIYAVASGGGPGALLSNFTEMDVSSLGLKNGTNALALTAGEYWVYVQVSASVTLNVSRVAANVADIVSYSSASPSVIGAAQSRIPISSAYAFPPPAAGAVTLGASSNNDIIVPVFFKIS